MDFQEGSSKFSQIWIQSIVTLGQWFPTLGNPDVLRLKLPEGFSTACARWGFGELQFKNIWATQGQAMCGSQFI